MFYAELFDSKEESLTEQILRGPLRRVQTCLDLKEPLHFISSAIQRAELIRFCICTCPNGLGHLVLA